MICQIWFILKILDHIFMNQEVTRGAPLLYIFMYRSLEVTNWTQETQKIAEKL